MKPDDLNLLYHASLEFGENWRRSLHEWAAELFSDMEAEELVDISSYIETARDEIERYVAAQYDLQTAKGTILQWICQKYPWMDQDNAAHGYSQGMYYAWHG
jgi:hypothetical protein